MTNIIKKCEVKESQVNMNPTNNQDPRLPSVEDAVVETQAALAPTAPDDGISVEIAQVRQQIGNGVTESGLTKEQREVIDSTLAAAIACKDDFRKSLATGEELSDDQISEILKKHHRDIPREMRKGGDNIPAGIFNLDVSPADRCTILTLNCIKFQYRSKQLYPEGYLLKQITNWVNVPDNETPKEYQLLKLGRFGIPQFNNFHQFFRSNQVYLNHFPQIFDDFDRKHPGLVSEIQDLALAYEKDDQPEIDEKNSEWLKSAEALELIKNLNIEALFDKRSEEEDKYLMSHPDCAKARYLRKLEEAFLILACEYGLTIIELGG